MCLHRLSVRNWLLVIFVSMMTSLFSVNGTGTDKTATSQDSTKAASNDTRLTLVVGRGYRVRYDTELWEQRRQFSTQTYNMQPSKYKLFVDPDSDFEEAHIVAKFQDSFDEIEMWLKNWIDPKQADGSRCNDDGTIRRFDRIVFDRVPNDPVYGIPWVADLIERTFEKLLHDNGTMEWYGSRLVHWPHAVNLDPEKFDVPIQMKMDPDGVFDEDGAPMTLRKKGSHRVLRPPQGTKETQSCPR